MQLNDEEKIKTMLLRTRQGDDSLRVLNEQLRRHYDRLEVIAKQYRRRAPIKDTAFQEEFRAAVALLRAFADDAQTFWNDTRMCYYAADKKEFVREHRIIIKQLKAAAVSLSRQRT